MPWMAWSPKGDRLAYFVRTEKERTLIVQNVLTRKIEERIADEVGRRARVADLLARRQDDRVLGAARRHRRHLHRRSRQRTKIVNLTVDDFADYGPTYSPDGKFIVYNARVSGNQKLFRFDLDTKKKTQLTFGTDDETAAQFIDDHTIVFSSTATDPNLPLDPEVAKNGNIFNIWTLDMSNGELRQYTDALGGNALAGRAQRRQRSNRIAFVTYYKGEYGMHTLERKEPLHTAATADFGAPGPIIDFQAPMKHTLVAANARKKRHVREDVPRGPAAGERRRHQQRRHLRRHADHLRRRARRSSSSTSIAASIRAVPHVRRSATSTWRGASSSRCRASRRPSSSTAQLDGVLLRSGAGAAHQPQRLRSRPAPSAAAAPSASIRSTAIAGSSCRPALVPVERAVQRPGAAGLRQPVPDSSQFGQQVFRNGTLRAARRRVRPGDDDLPRVRSARRQHHAAGLRRRAQDRPAPCRGRPSMSTPATTSASPRPACWRCASAASRASATSPTSPYFGGNSEMRGYDYLQFAGQNVVFANAELRFPIIEAALTPIGVIGGIRGVFFANIGGGWFNNQGLSSSPPPRTKTFRPDRRLPARTAFGNVAASTRATNLPMPIYGATTDRQRFPPEGRPRLVRHRPRDLRARLPDPLRLVVAHDVQQGLGRRVFAADGGSAEFRKPRFAVWIGYDF